MLTGPGGDEPVGILEFPMRDSSYFDFVTPLSTLINAPSPVQSSLAKTDSMASEKHDIGEINGPID